MSKGSNINITLDNILARYYHKTTPAGEKTACLNVFNTKCSNNNINATTYKQAYEDREVTHKNQRRPNRTTTTSSSNQDFEGGFGGFWDDIFRGSNFDDFYNNYHSQSNSGNYGRARTKPKEEQGPKCGSYAYEVSKNSEFMHGTIKDCMYTVYGDKVTIQALLKVGDRWAIENFVFYSGSRIPDTIKELKKYDMFKFTSNRTRYANNLNINKIWGLDLNMKEHQVY